MKGWSSFLVLIIYLMVEGRGQVATVTLFQSENLGCPFKPSLFVCNTFGTNLIWMINSFPVLTYTGKRQQVGNQITLCNNNKTEVPKNICVKGVLASEDNIDDGYSECSSILEILPMAHIPNDIEITCEADGLMPEEERSQTQNYTTGVIQYFSDDFSWVFRRIFCIENTSNCYFEIKYSQKDDNEKVTFTVMNGNSSIFTGSIPPARKFTTMLLEDSDKLLGEEVTISADSTCNSSTKTTTVMDALIPCAGFHPSSMGSVIIVITVLLHCYML